MRAPVTFALLALVTGSIAVAGCGNGSATEPRTPSDPSTSEPLSPPSPKPPESNGADRHSVMLTGRLRGGMMAIGGEHTGWAIESETGDLHELDLSRVFDHARGLSGQRVTLRGEWTRKRYVERGEVPILMVTSISSP